MIYLDNSSTTYKKPLCVKRAVKYTISKENINPSRANYKKAIILAEKIYKTRELIGETFEYVPEFN